MADLGARVSLSLRGRAAPVADPILKLILDTDLLERDQPEDIAQRVAMVRRFLAVDAQDRRAQLALARLCTMEGQVGEARALLAPLAERFPQDRDVLAAQGECALASGELESAQQVVARATDFAADDTRFAILRGAVAEASGDRDGAVEHFRRAIALQPLSRQGHYHLGRVLQVTGHADESRTELELVERLDKLERLIFDLIGDAASAEVWERMGQTCEALYEPEAARACYEQVLTLDASRTEARESVKRRFVAPGQAVRSSP